MRQSILLLLAITFVALLSLVVVVPSFGSSAESSQFVTYRVAASNSSSSFAATVNETVSPSGTSSFSDLTLQFVSGQTNFTFSRLVNSTLPLLPYLPAIGNLSFNYQGNHSISVSMVKTGTSTVTFTGSTYSVTNYSFKVSLSEPNGSSISASGTLSTFPSGLVYSAVASATGCNVQVTLLATNLSLVATSSSSSASTPIIIGSGVGIAALGLGVFSLYRRKNVLGKQSEEDKKPLYHVD